MAAIDQSQAVNGFNGQSYNDHNYHASEYGSAPSHNQHASHQTNQDIPKDEVGWYFVEQYYTTLSKNPEKLFLFYNKRSQYVSGTEAEKVMTCVGQKAIHDRITNLGIQDCKVRVTNVDSQGSGANIVIQVIGEISNKGEPQKKFVQTFVLAEQTNGYFVLNDIFRYILEDEEDAQDAAQLGQEPQIPAIVAEHANLPATDDAAVIDHAASAVDHKLQDEAAHASEEVSEVNLAAPVNVALDEPVPEAVVAEDAPAAAPAVQEDSHVVKVDEVTEPAASANPLQPDVPKEPEPTPTAQSPGKQALAPAKPATPTTWAGLVAGSRVALPSTSTSSGPPSSSAAAAAAATTIAAKSKGPVAVAPPTAPAIANAAASEINQPNTPASSGSEWQTAHRDGHSRKQSRAQTPLASGASAADNSRGYIKNVSAAVTDEALKEKLNGIGKVVYFDVNRTKNCAFVDFADATAYQAAVAASPIEVAGERLFVEERRVKTGISGNFNGRGGFNNRGRGGDRAPAHGRGGFQRDGGRGGFNGRGGGRGGGAAAGGGGGRGRGGSAQTA